jgi:toxin ParE1/3/4
MKRCIVVFSPRAERQLHSLHAYIADRGGEATADDFVGGIVDDCLSLSTFPERGTLHEDIRPGLRTVGYKRRVTIAFSVDSAREPVVIHGVFYGGQDFEAALRDDAG